MAVRDPVAELDPRFSSDGATLTPWAEARGRLEKAEIYWLATVRPDGRPHVTPLISVWLDGALYFCTGASERKAKNLAGNTHCVVTTGCNALNEGLDLVVEGDATRVSDEAGLQSVADAYASKYDWHFTVRDGAFHGDAGNVAVVYEVRPKTAFGFGKGETYSQTRWRFCGEPESDLPAHLAGPARRALAAAGYARLEQFTQITEAEITRLHGMGPKALERIRRALAARGLSFADGPRGAPDVDSGRLRTT
jgi:general stress protein 26